MITLTTQQILGLARDKLLEIGDAIVTSEKLLIFANLAQDEIAKDIYTDDMTISTTLSFVGGVATIPTDWESHRLSKDSLIPGQGSVFEWVNLEDFRAGKYTKMIAKINGQLAVYPTSTATLYTDYYKKLPNMSISPVVNSALDPSLVELIVYGILYRAFEDLQEWDIAKEMRGKFETEKQLKARRVSQAEKKPQKSGEMFNPISIIPPNGGSYRNSPNSF